MKYNNEVFSSVQQQQQQIKVQIRDPRLIHLTFKTVIYIYSTYFI
jgi:hypothetical protein